MSISPVPHFPPFSFFCPLSNSSLHIFSFCIRALSSLVKLVFYSNLLGFHFSFLRQSYPHKFQNLPLFPSALIFMWWAKWDWLRERYLHFHLWCYVIWSFFLTLHFLWPSFSTCVVGRAFDLKQELLKLTLLLIVFVWLCWKWLIAVALMTHKFVCPFTCSQFAQ